MPRHPVAELFRSGSLPPGSPTGTVTVLRDVVDPASCITAAALRQKLEVGLLRRPYVTFRRNGHEVPAGEYTENRQCVGATLDGFVKPAAAHALLEDGATAEFRRLADWHRPSRTLADDIRELESVAVSVSAVLRGRHAPELSTRPARNVAATLMVQLYGEQHWEIGASRHETVTLGPGDVLHLPARNSGTGSTADEASLSMAVELVVPVPDDFLAALRQHLVDTDPDLILRYHLLPRAMRSAAVRDRLLASVRELSDEVWQSKALARTRERTG